MNGEVIVFESNEFGQIRTITMDGEVYFVGKDVAEKLGYSNARYALAKHVDAEDKGVAKCDTRGGKQGLTIINESGLYALVFGSKLESAKRFKRWVTSEVLPSIRKTGSYKLEQPSYMIENPAERARRWADEMEAKQGEIRALAAVNEEMKPKAVFADAVSASRTSINIGDLAKLLKQNGIDMGQKRLFGWLRDNGWLMKGGTSKNLPTQKGMEQGLFEIKEGTYIDGHGVNVTTKTPKVTGKGQIYFVNKFLAEKAG